MADGPHAVAQLLNRLRMRQVALLLAVEASGTLRAAAARLGMTQPAATKMLHELNARSASRCSSAPAAACG